MDTFDPQGRPRAEKATVPLQAKLAVICAAIITFQCVLFLAAGFASALDGMLDLADGVVWGGVGLAFLLALVPSVWLFRRGLEMERETVTQRAD